MWWTQSEKCGDESWIEEVAGCCLKWLEKGARWSGEDPTNLNYCGGFFRNWTWAAAQIPAEVDENS